MTTSRAAAAAPWQIHLDGSSRGTAVELLVRSTLVAAWTSTWRAAPDDLCLSSDGRTWITNAHLEQRSRVAARRLAAAGVRAGDRLLLSATPSVDMAIAHVGALRLGCAVVPMNTAYLEREVAHIVADAHPAAAVVDDDDRRSWVLAAAAEPIPVLDPSLGTAESDVELDACRPDDLALLIYTSGTTGAPKGAMLTHGNLLAGTEAVRIAWRWTPADRLILTLPLFHLHGLGVGLHGTLLAGASCVIRPSFDADEVLALASSATLFFAVPTMYTRLVAHEDAARLGGLRLLVSGSAPLPEELFEEVRRLTGHAVLERYGMSETLMNLSNPYDAERRAGTVGLPLPGVEVQLGETGEIQLRGPNVFAGYWGRPEATAASFTDDGWFLTGDIGEVDAEGYHRIVGRTKELIISGGYNVYPREVEEVLRRHPGVADVAVVGTPSPEWGEIVTAYVVASGPCDEDGVKEFAATELASYKRPRIVHFLESLPRNALGKVLRNELRAP